MRFLTFTLLLSVFFSLGAADNIVVRQKSGDTTYAIAQISHITFPSDGSGVVINYTDNTSQTFPRTDFISLRFNGEMVGMDLVSKNEESALVYDAATATIILVGADAPICVYSSNGALVAETTENKLNVSHLACGTYVVKAGALTSKILKR